jgi:murein DD-endopeptidase MepM/ murein hydrolase activator NlpD
LTRGFYIVVAILVIGGAAANADLSLSVRDAERSLNTEERFAVQTAQAIQRYRNAIHHVDLEVESGSSFPTLLTDAGVDETQVAAATEAGERAWNLHRLAPGHAMWFEHSIAAGLTAVSYRLDLDRELRITRVGNDFMADILQVPSHIRTAVVRGKIEGSLYETLEAAGEHPELAVRMAQILAWDMDFYTDPRPGDAFSIVVEKKEYIDGQFTYTGINAVRYDNAGRVHEAVRFHDLNGKAAYYTSDGKSLQKSFLKSPLKFAARVSSHFSQHRYHPVLKLYRPHLGTDYAAPIGTPVQAVASGRVVSAGASGGSGNMVKIQHANGYETYYLHLSRILVRLGATVQQGQRIGLVGMTGLATGPHLDFRVQRRGQFVNFERIPLPQADPVAKKDWAEFAGVRDQWVPLLRGSDTAVAQVGKGAEITGAK